MTSKKTATIVNLVLMVAAGVGCGVWIFLTLRNEGLSLWYMVVLPAGLASGLVGYFVWYARIASGVKGWWHKTFGRFAG